MENLPQNPDQFTTTPTWQNQNQSRRILPAILVLLAILIGGYFAIAKFQSWWPFEKENTSILTTSNDAETANWPIYRNSQFGFEVKYPGGWEIQDLSFIYQDKINLSFWIFGPWRNDVPGTIDNARFAEQVYYDSIQGKFVGNEVNPVPSFNYPKKPGDQAVRYVDVSQNYIKNSPEYKIAQDVIASAAIISNTNPLSKISIPSQDGCVNIYGDIYQQQEEDQEVIKNMQVANNLPTVVKSKIQSYLDQGLSIYQVCKRGNSIFAYALSGEGNNVSGRPVIVAFIYDSKQMKSFIENTAPTGANGGCSIKNLFSNYLEYECGWGDGPQFYSRTYRLNFDSKPAILIKDCSTFEEKEICK